MISILNWGNALFRFDDPLTNSGLIINTKINNLYKNGEIVKVCIHVEKIKKSETLKSSSFNFACDISSTIEHILMHSVCELDLPQSNRYRLKVHKCHEYFQPNSKLSDYEYVHHCLKLDIDVHLGLVSDEFVDSSLKRTQIDDKRFDSFSLKDLISEKLPSYSTRDTLLILLDTFDKEIDKIKISAKHFQQTNQLISLKSVFQSIKMICVTFGSIESAELYETMKSFQEIYSKFTTCSNNWANFLPKIINSECNRLKNSLTNFLKVSAKFFRTDFEILDTRSNNTNGGVDGDVERNVVKQIFEINETLLLKLCGVHKLHKSWNYDSYFIIAQVYHGTRPLGSSRISVPVQITQGFFPLLLLNYQIDFDDISICLLPKESRCVFTLYGRTYNSYEPDDKDNGLKLQENELGWASVQLFNYSGEMISNDLILTIWPPSAPKIIVPAPFYYHIPFIDSPLLSITLAPLPYKIKFPTSICSNTFQSAADFSSLDINAQQQLLEIIHQDTLSKVPVEEREILWEKRHYLYKIPEALPKVLLAAHSWDWACLADLHNMLRNWSAMTAPQALQLLLPCFPDYEVRKLAVKSFKEISDDELIDYLPQLMQSIQYETYLTSPLVEFLVERSLRSLKVAHYFYWILNHDIPDNPVCSFLCDESVAIITKFSFRCDLLNTMFLNMCGNKLRECFITQKFLVMRLNNVAREVRDNKDTIRQKSILSKLEDIHQSLVDNPTSLPISLAYKICGIHAKSCNFFTSRTFPLKINFISTNSKMIATIYKIGDDLRQDMLTLQIVNVMNKLWLAEGLDLKMLTFVCTPTGYLNGMMELVTNAETLRKIQIEFGLTGSFQDKPIAEWLAKHNASEVDYQRACENFTASCAGYSVVTYILGIGDRHNDNIMVKHSGHIFHIDFGKFLGDAEKFGNFKRDRVPFVLSSDMVYVINGGDKPSARFHYFIDLCCQAFNVIRKNRNLILHLLTLMVSTGIKGVTMQAVDYVHSALLPSQSNAEAAATFSRLIQTSVKSKFTQFNFFLHNLAQLRYTTDHQSSGDLLSFVSKTHNILEDGRIENVDVLGYQKRYDPEKYYLYVVRVERQCRIQSRNILRTYKEFCEFHQKLCLYFPLAKVYSLPSGLHIGRSNVNNIAQKRLSDLRNFLKSLFETADEISHSKLVYTFFHPLLRDEQPLSESYCPLKSDKKNLKKTNASLIQGDIKLSLNYNHGALSIMIYHVRGLPVVNGSQPSTYVKVYLRPDPMKITKRKTKVIRKNCFPSFMEMLEYRLPLDFVQNRTLQATVWVHDTFQENEFLGGVSLNLNRYDLKSEIIDWFPLQNVSN